MSFLNMAGLNKIVKSAYAVDRLKVGAFEDHTVIATPNCIFVVGEDFEPNRMKAIITQHLGHLPVYDPTTVSAGFVEIGKNIPERELEPDETKNINTLAFPTRRQTGFVITPVTITERGLPVRIIQDLKTNNCRGIRQEYLDLIDNRQLNYEVEGDPVGPMVDESTNFAYFTNATTTLIIGTYLFSMDKSKEIMGLLQLTELREKTI